MMAYPALSTIKRLISGKTVQQQFRLREEADCNMTKIMTLCNSYKLWLKIFIYQY